jgi:hypothetical protein
MLAPHRPTFSARSFRLAIGILVLLSATGCRTAGLSPSGAQVATSQSAPLDSGWDPASCRSLGYVVGRGGGSFSGGWLTNEDLIAYAMNDLRNRAANLGANFIQHDSPTMGQAGNNNGTTTTTATISGTAYICDQKSPAPVARAPSQKAQETKNGSETNATPRCMPGSTQACLGPGACRGAQFCAEDGTHYSVCDCGTATQ